ncbi:MAG: glycosyltransferase family 2 protein [Desulfobacteraceae bacterium]|nr:MAG: glycosyltransferase family 2 protein [Desulfobacteraceae bacterium]
MDNKMLPLVSIGMPTFNRADGYLKEAIQCAVNQTYPNLEIIISDNCSADNTAELVAGFSDPRIQYHQQTSNIGAINNYNYILKQSKGEYFLMLHSDDTIDSDHIESCIRALGDKSEVGIICTGVRVIDQNGKTIAERPNQTAGLSFSDYVLHWFENKIAIYMCNTLYNTKKLKEIGGFSSPKNLYPDTLALFYLLAEMGSAAVHDVKAGFRMHSGNTGTAVKVADWCDDSLYLLKVICDLAPDRKETLREKGMRYFCRQNYGIAATMVPPSRLFWAYTIVAKKFKFSYSPLQYALEKDIKPRLRKMKKRIF